MVSGVYRLKPLTLNPEPGTGQFRYKAIEESWEAFRYGMPPDFIHVLNFTGFRY